MTYILIDSQTLMKARLEAILSDPVPPEASPFQIRSTVKHPASKRVPVKHLLLGSPPAVRHTIHRLHQLHYAEANEWSKPLALPDIAPQPLRDRPLIITPDEDDVVVMLIRYLNLE